jgi:DNA-directed RNA polymerase subunit RPC12/RpoP
MRPRNLASAVVESNQAQPRAEETAGSSYECVLCGTRWSYPEIHNTARCPACGGGLVRVADTELAR